jgi:hypothetical protein
MARAGMMGAMETTPAHHPSVASTRSSARSRWLTVGGVATAAALLLGCGFISQARQIVDAATTLAELSELLEGAAQLSYTTEYEGTGGVRVTLTQDPPNAAWRSGSQALIFTEEHLIICDDGQCQRSPQRSSDVRAAEAGLIGGMMGPGFVTPEMALGLVALATFVPGANVDSSERTMAGQKSHCAEVTGLDAADESGASESLRDFTICVTDRGILARFSGVSTAGEEVSVELVSFTELVDPAAFEPPAGAAVTDIGQ